MIKYKSNSDARLQYFKSYSKLSKTAFKESIHHHRLRKTAGLAKNC